jgi:hypothetical protein
MQLYRFDLTFSYWILTWYLLYMAGIVKASPKFVILLGLIANSSMLVSFIWMGVPLKTIGMFLGLMLVMKVIPYWTLRRVPFSWSKDATRFIIIYLVYLLWLEFNGVNLFILSEHTKREYKSGNLSPKWTPGSALVHDLMKGCFSR